MTPILEPPLTQDLHRSEQKQELQDHRWRREMLQILRFGLVGSLNTVLDLLILNSLLWVLPTKDTTTLLVYNTIAYAIGSINSFLLNKYWTFRQEQHVTVREVRRFVVTTVFGILCNDALIWLTSNLLHPLVPDVRLWANISKLVAIGGTVFISYLGMRLWVFAKQKRRRRV